LQSRACSKRNRNMIFSLATLNNIMATFTLTTFTWPTVLCIQHFPTSLSHRVFLVIMPTEIYSDGLPSAPHRVHFYVHKLTFDNEEPLHGIGP
jgi:hypothetical protein